MVPGGGQGTRAALRSAGAGEIVEVPGGGRIVRSAAGRKDRHSKVCTAKGTRDRRVRLAAHTAIQFYDVQDRLGYDRPSKAVDWLMKKAKSAIDALDELPTWKPVSKSPDGEEETAAAEVYDGNMLPPSMESDSIADTIKSFFPVAGEGSATSTSMGLQSMQFQSFPSSDLLAMRDCNQSQDLKLSLQSLQDPIMIQSHQNNPRHSHQNQEEEEQSQFPGAAHIGFVNQSAGWDDESQQHTDSGRFQRLIGWNLGGYGGGGNGGGGFMFIPPQNSLQQNQMLFSHDSGQNSSHLFTNRESLQSSIITHLPTANSSHHLHHHHHDQSVTIHPMSFPGIGLGSSGGFSGFCIPARIQGDEEDEHNGNPKPFSLSSTSRH